MNMGNSFKLSRKIPQPDGSELIEERTNSTEWDFTKLAIAIILAIIAYELAKKGVSVPALVWILIEVVLILYVVVLAIQLVMVFYIGLSSKSG